MRFASLKSSNPAVRARLQAALFTNRKRNRARREAGQGIQDVWGTGSIVLGQNPEEGIGYSIDFFGSVNSQPNPTYPLLYFLFDADSVSVSFVGAISVLFSGATLEIGGQSYSISVDGLGDDGENTFVNFTAPSQLYDETDVGQTVTFSFSFSQ
jgi:hypothetical protein